VERIDLVVQSGYRSETIRALMSRHVRRYRSIGEATMPPSDRNKLLNWYTQWQAALRVALANALNDEQGIIAREWHYDYIVKHNSLFQPERGASTWVDAAGKSGTATAEV
jgi:hypothetical protein